MPTVDDLKQSRFLTKRDVARPILVTIKGYEQMNVARQSAEPDMRYVLYFHGDYKPMTLNKTNGQLIAAITGSEEFDDWIGKKIVLFFDPTVDFGGELVGGIRCRPPQSQPVQHQTESNGLDPAELAREEGELAQKITNPDNPPSEKRYQGGSPVPEGERDEVDDFLETES